MRELSLAIVGGQHPNKRGPSRQFEIAMCAPGEPVELRPEPENPADPHAIAVFSARGVQIGYLTAERAPWIGGMLKSGREVTAIFQEATAYGGVARAAFDGEQPILPTPKPIAEPEQDDGFWPDPIYDDD